MVPVHWCWGITIIRSWCKTLFPRSCIQSHSYYNAICAAVKGIYFQPIFSLLFTAKAVRFEHVVLGINPSAPLTDFCLTLSSSHYLAFFLHQHWCLGGCWCFLAHYSCKGSWNQLLQWKDSFISLNSMWILMLARGWLLIYLITTYLYCWISTKTNICTDEISVYKLLLTSHKFPKCLKYTGQQLLF